MSTATIAPFGLTKDGLTVHRAVLEDGYGNSASFLSYGATMQSVCIRLPSGELRDVCLGYDDVGAYETQMGCMGGLIGRSANRIFPPTVEIDGQQYCLSENRPGFHMHGGFSGFHQRLWQMTAVEDAIQLSLESPDGDEGYPGNLHVEITVRFSEPGVLEMQYDAVADRSTVIALTNHSYFNLNGHDAGNALRQRIMVPAEEIVAMDNGFFADGRIPVENTAMDLWVEGPLGPRGSLPLSPRGLNFCYLQENRGMHPCARLVSEDGLVTMEFETDFPAVQVYDGHGLTERSGKGGCRYSANSGICLEPQYVPNAVNLNSFRKPIFGAGEHFRHTARYSFTCREA